MTVLEALVALVAVAIAAAVVADLVVAFAEVADKADLVAVAIAVAVAVVAVLVAVLVAVAIAAAVALVASVEVAEVADAAVEHRKLSALQIPQGIWTFCSALCSYQPTVHF